MTNCIIDPQKECIGLAKAELIEKQLSEHKENSRKDHAEMFNRIRMLEIAHAETKTQYGQIMESLGALRADINDLKSKPSKRWDTIVDKVLIGVIGAIVVYIMTQIGF